MSQSKKELGNQAEQLACAYLKQQGLLFIKANFSVRLGEIDLIMRDAVNDTLVFVEVRYRKNSDYGGAAASVTPRKQQKIIKTAAFYLQCYAPDSCARFDVVALEGNLNGCYQLNWIADAFQAF